MLAVQYGHNLKHQFFDFLLALPLSNVRGWPGMLVTAHIALAAVPPTMTFSHMYTCEFTPERSSTIFSTFCSVLIPINVFELNVYL